MVEHNVIPDAERHEPKGASTASTNEVIKSNGSGATSWGSVDYSELAGTNPSPVLGVYDYEDVTTTGAPIALTVASTDYPLTNDAAGSATSSTYGIVGITPWNESTGYFDFSDMSLGDTVDIRLDVDVVTGGSDHEVSIDLILDVGGLDVRIPFTRENHKSSGTHRTTVLNSVYIGEADIRDGNARFVASSDNTGDTIVVNGWYVKVLNNG